MQKSKLLTFAKWCFNLPTMQPECEEWIASIVNGEKKSWIFKHYLDKWLSLLYRCQTAEEAFLRFVCEVGDPEIERLEQYIMDNFKA